MTLEKRPLARAQEGSGAKYDEQPQSEDGGQLSGYTRDATVGERGEKDADFLDGDGTKLMPDLRHIHKVGKLLPRVKEKDADYSNIGIEDLDAGNQSVLNPPISQSKTEGDVSTSGGGDSGGTMGDNPIEDNEENGNGNKLKHGHLITKEAYSLQGRMKFQGLPIAVENRAGSVRRGVDKNGHHWETKMRLPYGYIAGTKGADGDGVDVYVGPDKEAPNAYVVHQKDPETGEYDEDKVILGVSSKREAKEAFMAHYDDPEKFLGPISEVSMQRLSELVKAKGRLVKISQVSYAAMLSELAKLAADEQDQQLGQPMQFDQHPSPIKSFVGDIKNTRNTVNLARTLWQAREAIPMIL